ncbi:unnamed protein product [Penicillium bialowiezense]
MRVQFLIGAFLASLAQADDASSSIRGYFSPSWEAGWNGVWTSTAASIAGINADATTYHVGCVKDAPKSACDLVNSVTIIQGAATASFDATYIAISTGSDGYDLTLTETWDCSLVSTTESASCTMSISMAGSANAPMNKLYYSLTVTGGLESFTAPAATKTPDAAAAGPAGALITAAPIVAAAVAALL